MDNKSNRIKNFEWHRLTAEMNDGYPDSAGSGKKRGKFAANRKCILIQRE